jgi:glutathione S-transferase
MLLIGMFDSPYVRRVAISMKRLGFPFEHGNWSVGADFERIRQYSPLGRVPVLVMDDGVALSNSSAILGALVDRCEALPEFKATYSKWFASEMRKPE